LLQEEREYVNSLLVLYMSTVPPFLGWNFKNSLPNNSRQATDQRIRIEIGDIWGSYGDEYEDGVSSGMPPCDVWYMVLRCTRQPSSERRLYHVSYSSHIILSLNVVVEWLTLLRIWEVPDSNLGSGGRICWLSFFVVLLSPSKWMPT
jgi:hypothetical protein